MWHSVEGPALVWAICTVARSGSTWLSDLVASTNRLGYPDEYLLNWPGWCGRLGLSRYLSCEEYLHGLVRQRVTPNGVFAIKGSVEELAPFFELFPNAACVWLRRENRIEQAVSWYYAHDLGVWTHGRPGVRPTVLSRWTHDAEGEDRAVARALSFYDEIQRRERLWQAFFVSRPVDPLLLTYEDICLDPLAAVRRIASHLGLDAGGITAVYSPLQIVRSDASAELCRRVEAAVRARGPGS